MVPFRLLGHHCTGTTRASYSLVVVSIGGGGIVPIAVVVVVAAEAGKWTTNEATRVKWCVQLNTAI